MISTRYGCHFVFLVRSQVDAWNRVFAVSILNICSFSCSRTHWVQRVFHVWWYHRQCHLSVFICTDAVIADKKIWTKGKYIWKKIEIINSNPVSNNRGKKIFSKKLSRAYDSSAGCYVIRPLLSTKLSCSLSLLYMLLLRAEGSYVPMSPIFLYADQAINSH